MCIRDRPSLARIFVTLLHWLLLTQMFAPSKTAHVGAQPTPDVVDSTVPSEARSFVTELLWVLTTQMLAPSKACLLYTSQIEREGGRRGLLNLGSIIFSKNKHSNEILFAFGVPNALCPNSIQ